MLDCDRRRFDGYSTTISSRPSRAVHQRACGNCRTISILIAIQLTIANLRQIDLWKRDHGSDADNEKPEAREAPDATESDTGQAHPEPRLRPPDLT